MDYKINALFSDKSQSPTPSKLQDPNLEKMKRHLKSCSKLRNLRSLTNTHANTGRTTCQRIELDKALDAMASTRRQLISFIQLNSLKTIGPENIAEIRKKYVPKDYLDHINSKKNIQIKKYRDELLSRNPLNNAMYQIRALSRESKRKIFSNLESALPCESRFNALKKSHAAFGSSDKFV